MAAADWAGGTPSFAAKISENKQNRASGQAKICLSAIGEFRGILYAWAFSFEVFSLQHLGKMRKLSPTSNGVTLTPTLNFQRGGGSGDSALGTTFGNG